MPYKKIAIPPGIDRESTQSSSEGSWYEANNVRWRDKYTQSIGGWVRDEAYVLEGFGRGMQAWTDFLGNIYQCIGTTFKYYLISGSDAIDITPVRTAQTGLSGAIMTSVAVGDGTVEEIEVTDNDHGIQLNDFIIISNATNAVDGITAAQLNAAPDGFQVHQATTNTFRFKVPGATSGQTPAVGSGTFDMDYLINSGSLAAVTGSGWGVGTWGGENLPFTSYTGQSPFVTVTGGGSPIVTLHTNGGGGFSSWESATSNDQIYPQGLSGTVSGFDTSLLNDKWWTATDSGAGNDANVDVGFDIAAAGASGGSAFTFGLWDDSAGDGVTGADRGWSDGSSEEIVVNSLRTVSIRNFGEDLMFSNRGGPIYYYDTSANAQYGIPTTGLRAVSLTDFSGASAVPVTCDGFEISEGHGHVVAWGCNDIGATTPNNMLIRWSDRHNPFQWTPTASTEAGGEVLRHGSTIVSCIPTKDENVFFTDTAIYSMRYVGAPEVYGVGLVSSNVTSFSRQSAAAVDNSVYFMGNEQFYVYRGKVEPLPKKLSSYVFDNMNLDNRGKVFAGVNSAFTEVLWFYPEGDSIECNRYVTFNYSNGTWGMGDFDMSPLDSATADQSTTYNRTAWQDAGVFQNARSSYITLYDPNTVPETQKSAMMEHEVGTSGQGVAIDHFIESGEVDVADGESYVFYDKIMPDLQIFDATDEVDYTVNVDIESRDYPGAVSNSTSTISATMTGGQTTFTPGRNDNSIRGRGKFVSIKIRSLAAGFGWRMGDMRVRLRPDGKD
jgi:hypothetical protein